MRVIELIIALFVAYLYLLGIVIACGFWQVFFAICTPYGLYLVVEKFTIHYHLLGL